MNCLKFLLTLVCVIPFSALASTVSTLDDIVVIPGSEALSVRSIAQDDKGMIWFGTDKNLHSYDGYHILTHHDRLGNEDHFQINSLVCLENDHILLGCIDGVVVYDVINETFEPISFFKGNEVHTLLRGGDGDTVWIGSDSGLFCYSISEGTFSTVPVRSEDKPVNIWSLIEDDGFLYIGMRPGFGRLDLSGNGAYQVFPSSSLPTSFSTLGSMLSVGEGRLLLGSSSYLFDFDEDATVGSTISRFSWVKTMARSGDSILLGTDAGLYSYNLESGDVLSIKNTVVWGILEDQRGNIWFGSDNGLMVSMNSELFKRLDILPSETNNLYSSISALADGQVFAGGSYGMVVFNDGEEGGYRWYKMGDSQYPFRHNKIRQIVYDVDTDGIWALTAAGTVKYNPLTQQFDLFTADRNSFYNAYDMLLDGDKMWFATVTGLFCVKDGSISDIYDVRDGYTSSRIAQVIKDGDGRIWSRSMDRKVFYLDKEMKLHRFQSGRAAVDRADHIFSDSEGNIWIASGNHVFKVDPSNPESISREYTLKGDPWKEAISIAEVEGHIWATYSDGVYILSKTSDDITHIYIDEVYSGLYYDKSRSRVLLGALDRIDALYINDLERHLQASNAPVHITGVTVNDNYSVPYHEIVSGRIVLPHDYNTVGVNFTNYGYGSEKLQRFRYKLTGLNPHWNEIDSPGNYILFSDLSPGRYNLFLSAAGGDDPVEPAIRLVIRRPWYASVVAMLFYLLLASLLVYILLSSLMLRRKVRIERVQKAHEMSQAKSKINFFADVAHEFKTPLSLIIAPVSKLLQETEDPDKRRSLQLVHDNAMKLNSLIHLSLDFYNDRKDMGKSIITSSLEVVSFIKGIFQTYKENTPGLDFIFKSQYDEIHASMDVVKTETIISNILSNACKYTPEGGTIILTLDYDEESGVLSVRVTDSGVGIPEEELPYVFQRYYQSSRTKQEQGEGTGLGLSIVKSYVDILHGNVSVTSGASGTSFLISIPLSASEEEDTDAGIRAVDKNGDKPVVVIVDDNKSVCEFLVHVFGSKYSCLCAYNGKNGLKLCQDITPDLIISDVVMPVMDGLEMCRSVRQTPSLALVPIILLTAKDDTETEKNSINLNIDAFMGKPFDMDTLLAKADQLIGRSKKVEDRVRLKIISEPQKTDLLSQDEKFLVNLTRKIEENIDDSDLSVTKLSELCKYSEKQLYRKVKALTGMSTVEYIRSIRLKKAAQLLQNGKFTVSEVMYIVGFSNPSYFTRAFVSQFGKTPKEYMNEFKER